MGIEDQRAERRVGQIVGDNEGKPDLKSINEQLRQLWMAVHTLQGKSGDIDILAGETINGDLRVTKYTAIGNVDRLESSLQVRAGTEAPSGPNIDPVGSQLGFRSAVIVEADTTRVGGPTGGMVSPLISFVRALPDGTKSIMGFVGGSDDGNGGEGALLLNGPLGGSPSTSMTLQNTGGVNFATIGTQTANQDFFLTVGGGMTAIPAAGCWWATSTTPGIGFYSFDLEKVNMPTSGAIFVQGGDTLTVNTEGTYLFYFQSQCAGAANGIVNIVITGFNQSRTSSGQIGIGFSIATIVALNANDTIKVNLQVAGDRFGDTNGTTQLLAYRLN